MDCRVEGGVGVLQYIYMAHWLSGSGGIEKRAAFPLQHRLDHRLPAICFSFLFASLCIISAPLLYIWYDVVVSEPWSFISCWLFIIVDGPLRMERRGTAPVDSSHSSYCWSSPSFSLFFCALLSVRTQTALPVDHSEIRAIQKMSGTPTQSHKKNV